MDEHELALDLGRTVAQMAACLQLSPYSVPEPEPGSAFTPPLIQPLTAAAPAPQASPLGCAAAASTSPSPQALQAIAAVLQAFAQRHRALLDFDGFPLPTAPDDALCSYELFRDPGTGMTLYANALRGGIDSAIHEHGTWAVIAAVHGRERNRIYHRLQAAPGATHSACEADPALPPHFSHEVVIDADHPLVLAPSEFHSIHTDPDAPTLQLHLYGQALDSVGERAAYELSSGRLTLLR